MTIITEYRWKCDWCHQVSPVVALGEHPRGGWVKLPNAEWKFAVELHFCCADHQQKWLDERAREGVA